MVTFRYDDGTGEVVELEPVDNEFEYVADGDFWAVKAEQTDETDVMKWIPNYRIYEIEGVRSRIRTKRP